MKNSFRSYGVHDGLLGEIWTVIESFDKKPMAAVKPAAPSAPEKRKSEESTETEQPAKKLAIEETEQKATKTKKFDWIESSQLECSRKENNEIKFKKLFKKVRQIICTGNLGLRNDLTKNDIYLRF